MPSLKMRQAVKSERDHNQRELETFEKLQKQHQAALALADERLRDEVSLLIKEGSGEDRCSEGLRRVLWQLACTSKCWR